MITQNSTRALVLHTVALGGPVTVKQLASGTAVNSEHTRKMDAYRLGVTNPCSRQHTTSSVKIRQNGLWSSGHHAMNEKDCSCFQVTIYQVTIYGLHSTYPSHRSNHEHVHSLLADGKGQIGVCWRRQRHRSRNRTGRRGPWIHTDITQRHAPIIANKYIGRGIGVNVAFQGHIKGYNGHNTPCYLLWVRKRDMCWA